MLAEELENHAANLTPSGREVVATKQADIVLPPDQRDQNWDLNLQQTVDGLVIGKYTAPGFVVSADLEILRFRGRTGLYLEPDTGRASLRLLKMLKPDLRSEVGNMIEEVKYTKIPMKRTGLQFREGSRQWQVGLQVIPFQIGAEAEEYFLVLFEDNELLNIDSLRPNASTSTPTREVYRPQSMPTLQPLTPIIRKHKCPRCGCVDVYRSRRRGLIDPVLSIFHLFPFTCEEDTCRHRFYKPMRR